MDLLPPVIALVVFGILLGSAGQAWRAKETRTAVVLTACLIAVLVILVVTGLPS